MTSAKELYTQLRIDIASAFLLNREAEKSIYDQIAAEMASGDVQPSLMTKAFAEADGDEGKAKSLYIKYRFKEIREELVILHRQRQIEEQRTKEAERKRQERKEAAERRREEQKTKSSRTQEDESEELGLLGIGVSVYLSIIIVVYLFWWLLYATGSVQETPSLLSTLLAPVIGVVVLARLIWELGLFLVGLF